MAGGMEGLSSRIGRIPTRSQRLLEKWARGNCNTLKMKAAYFFSFVAVTFPERQHTELKY
jgi:hypothetical protein